uniref:Jerky-like n=2 Tax=Bactrocera latifrons TaxID=174628 RepID=A0A0K8V8A3_BACLA
MSQKRPKYLSLKEKVNVIGKLKAGSSVTHLANQHSVAKSTICAINKKKENILKCVNSTFSGPGKRKTLKCSELPKMEKALYRWFLKQRQKNYPVNGLIVKEKAKFFHSTIKETQSDFNASDGWLQHFKKRYGVRFIKISVEKLSSRPELMDPFKNKLQAKIKELGLSHDQIYNADELGLFWKLLPDRTYVSSQEKNTPGRKREKQRVTFLACTNAIGMHKVKLFVIGKAKNPRSFKNFDSPVDYNFSDSSWMTATISKHWFHHSFVPQVKKSVLVISNFYMCVFYYSISGNF